MKKILLVEDIHDNAALVLRILNSQGYETHWAEDGKSGFSMALDLIPDLILLDLGLPDIDGQTLSTWIKGQTTLREIPIIAMTAWPDETAMKMVDAYQLDGYIGKTYRVKELLAIIDQVLGDE